MLILGIDPGLRKTGWGIIESNGNSLRFCSCGMIKPEPKDDLAVRLAFLHEELTRIIRLHKPDSAAIEETFVNNNAASALKLGQARGVLLAVPAVLGVEIKEYTANKVKKSVVGTGHAAKYQVQMMVKTILPACGKVSEDEADALAVAICHAHHRVK